jgi:hypothetical protein
MAFNKLTKSPLKGRKRIRCEHVKLRAPVVIEGDLWQRCVRCKDYILVSRKKASRVEEVREHISLFNF